MRSVPANGRRPLRLLVALGRGLFRSGLCLLLRERWGVTVVEGEGRPWDLALADLEGPGGASLEPLRRLSLAFPKRPVLVVSGRPEELFGRRALEAGAAGFVSTS